MLRRLSVLTGEHASYSQIISLYRILTFHSIYDCFALLKAFNTNILNYHQYFKDKSFSHQPSHMHNTRHRTNSNFNTALFKCSKTKNSHMNHSVISNSHMNHSVISNSHMNHSIISNSHMNHSIISNSHMEQPTKRLKIALASLHFKNKLKATN